MNLPFKKNDLRLRLQNAGLWRAFLARREALKKEGMDANSSWLHAYEEIKERLERSEAKKKAQEQAPIQPLKGPLISPPEPIAQGKQKPRKPRASVDGRAEVDWVYRNIDEEAPTEEPPSTGTTGLMTWARENRSEFYRMWAGTSVPNKAQLEADERRKATDKTLDQLLKELRREARESDDEVLPGGPEGPGGES